MVGRERKDSELCPPAQTEHLQGLATPCNQSVIIPGGLSSPVGISWDVGSLTCRALAQVNTGVSPGIALPHGLCDHLCTTCQPGHHFSVSASLQGWGENWAGKSFL